ncbi:MAG: diaminopimelate decarboxylase [Clostridia bacterium]|nr:diaminopimelate decarboxylase [Clostridia bacterium]
MIQKSMTLTSDGTLAFGGADVRELAAKYGTPLIILDENRLRENMRMYLTSMRAAFGEKALPTYASKAMCFKEMYRILADEGMGTDVVSGGEMYTALKAGFPMERVYFHGDHKADWELELAVESGVGYIMADNEYELENLERICAEKGRTANIILRVTPGIDNHTFAAVNTGKVDVQFGRPIETGQALKFVQKALTMQHIHVAGFHCHIGSQIFSEGPFYLAAEKMLNFVKDVKDATGYVPEKLDLGGGFGVRYVESDPEIDIPACIAKLGEKVRALCAELDLEVPAIIMEPGRSIVADAGMTLYTAGAVKEVEGHRAYVIIDGGMADNPRYALYKSSYTVYNASRMTEKADFLCTISGRCCESGDLIQENVVIPHVQSGDLIAVAVTGAYNYSMASNYNRLTRPAVVIVKDGADRLAVRRESLEDLIRNDM